MDLAVCLDCRKSSYFHKTVLCVISNILGGCLLLHFNCDSEVPAEGTGYTSIIQYEISTIKYIHIYSIIGAYNQIKGTTW